MPIVPGAAIRSQPASFGPREKKIAMIADTDLGRLTAADTMRSPAMAEGGMVTAAAKIEVARTIAEVERLRPFWVAQPTNRDGDLDYCMTVVQSGPGVVRPHVITVNRGGQPPAMLIGRLETKALGIRFGYLRLPNPRLRVLTFIDGGVLQGLSAQDSDAVMDSILASLRAGEADVAVMEHLDAAHPLLQRARTSPPALCIDRFPISYTHYARRLGGGDAVLATLSANERSNQRRREKRLRQDFAEVRIDCFHDASDLDRLFNDAEAIARTSYQRGLQVGFADTAQMRRRLAFEAGKGTLRAHILYLDNQPCAFWIASLYRAVLANDFMAFDPAYGKYAPGMYLALNVLEEVRRDPAAGPDPSVDFGVGGGEWKVRLANRQHQACWVAVFAPTAKGIVVNMARTAAAFGDSSIRTVLRRTNLLPRIKRLWRRQLAG